MVIKEIRRMGSHHKRQYVFGIINHSQMYIVVPRCSNCDNTLIEKYHLYITFHHHFMILIPFQFIEDLDITPLGIALLFLWMKHPCKPNFIVPSGKYPEKADDLSNCFLAKLV